MLRIVEEFVWFYISTDTVSVFSFTFVVELSTATDFSVD